MGLDASVRCRCFEEGKLRPGPVPVEDLYIDEDGYIWSRKLHDAHEKYDHRRYEARYGNLESEFIEWLEEPCEHEDGDYCCEWVSNWGGCALFLYFVEEAGGEKAFPLLSKLLPEANGGIYPVEKAQATLDELDAFIAKVVKMDECQEFLHEGRYWTAERIRSLLLASIETGNPIRWC